MRLLLTSAGITNTSIHNALVDLLGKPICRVQRPLHSHRGAAVPRRTFTRLPVHQRISPRPHVRIGLEVVGSAGADRSAQHQRTSIGSPRSRRPTLCWSGAAVPCICATGCGSPDWPTSCRRCGARRSTSARAAGPWSRLPTSAERPTTTVTRSRAAIERWDWLISRCFRTSSARTCRTPPLANIERWAAGIPVPAYAIDDQTAIKVVDGTLEVVSEGHWKLFAP